MPTGYGYVERGDAGYVNWAAVTKGFTDVIDASVKDRKKKEEDYATQDRNLSKILSEQPLGQFEDGNTFTNNAVDAIKQQQLMDNKLWKAGKLSDKQYTLKQNNMLDNINTLFDLQKTYQEASADRMKGLQDKTYMPLTLNNMAKIEGFKDFKDSVPIIDPNTNIISIAKKRFNEKTKTWEIDKNNTMPVKMAMGLISTPARTFKVDEAIDTDVARMGELKDAMVKAATMYSAGSVTNFLGPEAFSNYPKAKSIIENYNKAIDQKIDSYFAGDTNLNLASVLTMNVGGYGSESFTYDKDEAAKDPSKILMKIDPTSKYPAMDQSGAHYEEQKKKAMDWVKTQFLSRIDREKVIQTSTGQTSRNEPSLGMTAREDKMRESRNLGEQLGKYLTGDITTASNANTYLRKRGIQSEKVEIEQPDKTKKTMVRFYNNDGQSFDYDPKQKTPELIKSAVAGISNLIKESNLLEDEVVNAAIKQSGGKNVTFEKVGEGYKGPKTYTKETNAYVSSNLDSQIVPDEATETASNLNSTFGALGFTFEPDESGFTDDIIIYKKGQDTSKEKGTRFSVNDKSQVKNILNWLTQNANATEAESFFVNNPDKTPNPAPAPGAPRPAPRPGGG